MNTYTLQAKLGTQLTTVAIKARDNFSAKILASQKINACYVADKRYAKGEITLRNPEGKIIWTIKEVIEEEKKEK